MTHKDAPQLTAEQNRMEAWHRDRLAHQGRTCGWGRDKRGGYLSTYARDAWAAWQESQRTTAP